MKMLWVLRIALCLLPLASTHAGQTAAATMFCWSLRFQQGQGPLDETLDLSTIAGAPNGELAPLYASYTHGSGFALDFGGFPITGNIELDLPPDPDANRNGFDDSFEVSQAVGGTSQGQYSTAIGGGTVSAIWNRAAGSKDGTCWLHLVDNTYGDLGTYRHSYEVLEYTGSLIYTPGTSVVSANLVLTNATGRWQGPMIFGKSVGDPRNNLTLQSATLNNAAQQSLTLFMATTFFRDPFLVTNYYGAVELNDGELNTVVEDFYSWELSIDDPNDSDHDGIPDFSDEPQSTSSRRPMLSLTGTFTNLLLAISGDVGRLHRVLESTDLAAGSWLTNLSITLTNDPQIVTLPLPPGAMKFWRVQAE